MTDPKLPAYRQSLSATKLDRIGRNLNYVRRHPSDGAMIDSFGYDHGHLLITDTNGKRDLLADRESHPLVRDAARVLCEITPNVLGELMRGYRIAREAGLLFDGNPPACEEVRGLYNPDEVYMAIRKKGRKAGGFDV